MKGSHEPFVHNGVSFPAAAEADGPSYAFENAGLPHLFEWRFPLENTFFQKRHRLIAVDLLHHPYEHTGFIYRTLEERVSC